MKKIFLFVCASIVLSGPLCGMKKENELDSKRTQLLAVYREMSQKLHKAMEADRKHMEISGEEKILCGIDGDQIVKKYNKMRQAKIFKDIYHCPEAVLQDEQALFTFNISMSRTPETIAQEMYYKYEPKTFIADLSQNQVNFFYDMYKKMGKITEK